VKIFCIGRNYAAHAEELNNAVPGKPLVFMKPPTAVLKHDRDFYIPDFSKDIHYEGELVLRIGKNGKSISPKFALRYISHITVGLDFTARDLQDELKSNGHPWEIAKGFDNSAVLGEWLDFEPFKDAPITYELKKNSVTVQNGDTSLLLFPFEQIIAHLSIYFTLQQGDIIFTGTPKGVGSIAPGDLYQGILGDQVVMTCQVR
jgi:2-keto-4-pentenoate hydratase/2-oxohepta-3-ene-1,7-dioic acid hydratase in catechol pathway